MARPDSARFKAEYPISLIDMAPTLLGLVESEIPGRIDGVDLSRVLLGEEIVEPSSVFIYRVHSRAGAKLSGNGNPTRWRVERRTYQAAYICTSTKWEGMDAF